MFGEHGRVRAWYDVSELTTVGSTTLPCLSAVSSVQFRVTMHFFQHGYGAELASSDGEIFHRFAAFSWLARCTPCRLRWEYGREKQQQTPCHSLKWSVVAFFDSSIAGSLDHQAGRPHHAHGPAQPDFRRGAARRVWRQDQAHMLLAQ